MALFRTLSVLKAVQRPIQSGSNAPGVYLARFFSSENYPKRPASSFFVFSQEKRPDVKSNNPGISIENVSTLLGTLWWELPEESRELYKDRARAELTEYKKKEKVYLASLTEEERAELALQKQNKIIRRQKKKTKKKIKLLMKPRSPPTAYASYVQKNFASSSDGDAPAMTIVVKLAAQWKALPDEEKEPLREMAKDKRNHYEEELAEWEEKMLEEGHPEVVRGYKPAPPAHTPPKQQAPAHRQELERLGKPKHTPTAYSLYMKDYFAKLSKVDSDSDGNVPGKNFSQAAIAWHGLEQSEKLPYYEQAKAAAQTYHQEKELWVQKMIAEGNAHLLPGFKKPKSKAEKSGLGKSESEVSE